MSDERREFGTLRLRGKVWYIRYRLDGREYWERAGTEAKARKLLERRRVEHEDGTLLAPAARRTTFDDLVGLIRDDYAVKGRRSTKTLEASIRHLAAFFGGDRALAITTDRVTAYERERLARGAARATVNKELAALRRMFTLAEQARRIPPGMKPHIATPDPQNARTGFLEVEDFTAILSELPSALRPLFQVAYWTGWRVRDELVPLTWGQVDFAAGVLRLERGTTKTGEGRTFPFDVLPELRALLERLRDEARQTGHLVPWVFHRNGKPIRSFDAAWHSAVRRAALRRLDDGRLLVVRPHLVRQDARGAWHAVRLPHDFRRTAARNLIRAGVPQHVVMKLCGWKTDAMFRRYAVVDERDLREAVAALARGTTGGQRAKAGPEAAAGAAAKLL